MELLMINNINENQSWGNNSVYTISLSIPSGLTAGQIVSLDLHTQFGGGISGDNWNLNALTLAATLDNSVPPSNSGSNNPTPQPVTITLVSSPGVI